MTPPHSITIYENPFPLTLTAQFENCEDIGGTQTMCAEGAREFKFLLKLTIQECIRGKNTRKCLLVKKIFPH